MRGRITLALYKRMQIADCIATDIDDYVRLAVRLGANGDLREQLRARILEAKAVLYDDQAGIRELEEFLASAVGSATAAS